jgi:hypothetical protein
MQNTILSCQNPIYCGSFSNYNKIIQFYHVIIQQNVGSVTYSFSTSYKKSIKKRPFIVLFQAKITLRIIQFTNIIQQNLK